MHSKATLDFLRVVLDEAWTSLTPRQRMSTKQSDLAAAILEAAAQGERDPAKLKAAAIGVREVVLRVG